MEIIRNTIKISREDFSSTILLMLEKNMDVALTITGNSMYPLWKHKRDSVILSNCNRFNLTKGDIPLYQRANGQYVLHRIIKVNRDSYDMCGDAQFQIEHNLPKENIIAVVKAFTRNGKSFNCSCYLFKIYSILWMWLFPLRRNCERIYRKIICFFKP